MIEVHRRSARARQRDELVRRDAAGEGRHAPAAHLDRPARGRVDRACTCTTSSARARSRTISCKNLIVGLGGAAPARPDHERREEHVLRRAAHPARRRRSSTSTRGRRTASPSRCGSPRRSSPPRRCSSSRRGRGGRRASETPGVGELRRAGRAETDASELSAEQLKAYLENLRPEDFGKFNL